MKHVPFAVMFLNVSLSLAPAFASATSTPLFQEAPSSTKTGTLTAEERAALEGTILADKRVRQIVGEEKPRLIIAEAVTDKAEAEAFLAGSTDKRPSRRVSVVAFNAKANKAAHVLMLLEERRILEVQEIKTDDVPLTREDAEEALSLAKANSEVRRALGEKMEQFKLVDPGSAASEPFAAQALPLRSTNPRDPCTSDRCLDLIFRSTDGYLPFRAHVDLTKRTVSLETKARQEGGGHP